MVLLTFFLGSVVIVTMTMVMVIRRVGAHIAVCISGVNPPDCSAMSMGRPSTALGVQHVNTVTHILSPNISW